MVIRKSFLEHWEELRSRIKLCLIVWFGVSLICFPLSPLILNTLQKYLLPKEWKVIVIEPLEVVIVEILTSLIIGLIISFPLIAFQIAKFIAPGLLPKEKKILKNIFSLCIIFFLGGVIFSSSILLPLTFEVLKNITLTVNVTPLISLRRFFEFTIFFIFLTGLLFNFPLFLLTLSKIGVLTPKTLEKNRKYVFLLLLFVTSIITPDPTPLTTLILMIPVWVLYELSIRLMKK